MAPAVAAPSRPRTARYVGDLLAVALAYYCAAKLGQALRYTASVSAVWPPAGVGIAALYLRGLRMWPAILVAELVINLQLGAGPTALPIGALLGQQVGNMAEVVLGAVMLRALIGSGARIDGAQRVGGVLAAVVIATAVSATVGTLSMLATDVIAVRHAPTFWRTWWLGDSAGALVVVPAALTWAGDRRAAWRRITTPHGAAVLIAVAALSVGAVGTSAPVTYIVFPALMWAAFRLGPPGATVAVVIAACVVIGITADDVGPFSKQPIDHKTLNTQVYVVVMALTTLLLTAVVSDRERTARALTEATRREGELAVEERHRIARDLHDSVSQALFSTALETRAAQKALAGPDAGGQGQVRGRLAAIAALTRTAQSEMRAMISELSQEPVAGGLEAALGRHVAALSRSQRLVIDVQASGGELRLHPRVEAELFGIAREALANVVKHADATTASVRVEARGASVLLEVRDDGRGFDASAAHPGHFGLDSMRGRAAEIGALVDISSGAGRGTIVRVEAPTGDPA